MKENGCVVLCVNKLTAYFLSVFGMLDVDKPNKCKTLYLSQSIKVYRQKTFEREDLLSFSIETTNLLEVSNVFRDRC